MGTSDEDFAAETTASLPWPLVMDSRGGQQLRNLDLVVTDSGGQQLYAHEDQLPNWTVKALGSGWLAEFAKRTDGYWSWGLSGVTTDDAAHEVIAGGAVGGIGV